jgi:hypothetical protein
MREIAVTVKCDWCEKGPIRNDAIVENEQVSIGRKVVLVDLHKSCRALIFDDTLLVNGRKPEVSKPTPAADRADKRPKDECTICGKSFARLASHMTKSHPGRKPRRLRAVSSG